MINNFLNKIETNLKHYLYFYHYIINFNYYTLIFITFMFEIHLLLHQSRIFRENKK